MALGQRNSTVHQRNLTDREAKKRRRQRLVLERCCLVFAALLAATTGVLIAMDQLTLVVVSFLGTFCSTALFFKCAEIEFGVIGITRKQFLVDFFLVVLVSIGIIIACLVVTMTPLPHAPVILGLIIVSKVVLLGTFSSFGAVCVTILALLILELSAASAPMSTNPITSAGEFQMNVGLYACIAGFGLSSRYKQDQCTCCLLGLFLCQCLQAGSVVAETESVPWPLLGFCAFLGYCLLLWRRTLRRLPPGLKGCKFVRLDYLRELVQSGEPIRRCQDLPAEAFGDPRKALHLIVVSHRWLNRYQCDLPTDEYPEGLRLCTMLERFEQYFSLKSFGAGSGLKERFNRICSALVGGNDVLIFFDFMCLPQEGLDADGEKLVERTPDEQEIFDSCVHQMSVLYSMFPVMVCDEVAPDCTEYLTSGWCYSELAVAALGKQLDFFSSRMAQESQLAQMHSAVQGDALQALKANFERELASKLFREDSDRAIVREIFDGFLLKAQLRNAIETHNTPEVQRVLSEIRRRGLEHLLDQPVDLSLNTLLHLAVARRFHEATAALLEFGADVLLTNIVGDAPWQWKMLPRLCNTAARACFMFNASAAGGSPRSSTVTDIGDEKEFDEESGSEASM
eukprot:TRINITY_DN8931_c0_g2_i1.p1 TRINITY_DN8931_c0_g2~~TRINITY_DN8931_c0_g2_i1.p1  ORF type:complete len:625 (-),score=99.65 TRINITY_DN8931_c0_g2_i1:115-1989(-)